MKIVNNLVFISAFLTLFFGVNVLRYFGYMIGGDDSPGLQKIFPSFFIIIIALFFLITNVNDKNYYIQDKKQEIYFLFFILIFSVFIYINRYSGLGSFVPNTILLPILFSLCLNIRNKIFMLKLQKVIIVFFIINSLLAILERVFQFHAFDIELSLDRELDYSGFRSTALQSHPLNNGLITSIILSFILISNFEPKYKYSLYFIGLISILCYGSRSSLIACIIMLLVILFKEILNNNTRIKKKSIGTFAILALGIPFIYYLLVNTSFGERLRNRGIYDESADVRIRVFDVFNGIDFNKLLWGLPSNTVDNIKYASDINIIENFWIVWVLKYGIIFTFFLTIFLLTFLLKKLNQYSFFNRMFLLFFFLIISSSNISLASTTGAVSIFIICSYVFSYNINFFPGLNSVENNSLNRKVREPVINQLLIKKNSI